jgi:predicted porin
VGFVLLRRSNVKDEFLTRVTQLVTCLWFNTCNFPKTEVGSEKFRAPVQTLENLEMKKTLVALAALAATSAFAQSSVTVYGVVDTAYYTAEAKTATKTTKFAGLTNSNLAGSRLGFKGTEDMGKGLKANFVAEMSLASTGDQFGVKADGAGAPSGNKTTDAAAAATFNRQTWVGLSSDKAGEVRVGYQNTLQYDHNGPFSAGFEGAAGAREHLEVLSGASLGRVLNAETNRATGVTYFAPTMGGVKLAAQWGAQKANVTTGAPTTIGTDVKLSHSSLSAGYANGPLALGAVYGTSAAQGNAVATSLYSTGAKVKTDAYSLGASYDLNVAKLFAYYGERETTNGTAAQDVKVKVYRIGAQVPMGAVKLFATMGQLNGDEGTTEVSNRKTSQFGALYSFSKRTTAFALYGKDKADMSLTGFTANAAGAGNGATATTSFAAADAAAPTTTSTMRIGINHSF